MAKSKEPVRLRQRLMASGNTSLYLDIYVNGKRNYEYLNLYLIPEVSRSDKAKNKETMRLAEAVRAKRVIEVQNGLYGFSEGYKLDTNFLEYYYRLCEQRHGEMSRGNWGNWLSAYRHLQIYCKPNLTFGEITSDWVRGFKEYLDKTARVRDKRKKTETDHDTKPLSESSKVSYFNKLRACINQAFEEKIIPHNPLRGVEGFKRVEVERVYLTLEEVRAMAAAECKYPVLRRAFLFSCLTGIRKSDIEKMTWKEVREEGGHVRIIFKQQKTKGQEYLDITAKAVPYLGERGADDDKVFQGFYYSSYMLMELKRWAVRAGITKDITFHTGRHTFAVLMMTLGAEIYTVQKLLGHREIHTTQIYAKIIDKKKQEAVDMIPDLFPPVEPESEPETESDTNAETE